jgi:hypothetical protein
VTVSVQCEDAEGLRVGRADLRARLLGFPGQPFLEEADAIPADLARVLGEGCSAKKCGLPAAGNTASRAISPAVRWSRWL